MISSRLAWKRYCKASGARRIQVACRAGSHLQKRILGSAGDVVPICGIREGTRLKFCAPRKLVEQLHHAVQSLAYRRTQGRRYSPKPDLVKRLVLMPEKDYSKNGHAVRVLSALRGSKENVAV
jgi:hypothetical protein